MTDAVLALDIGGTKFAAAIVDACGRVVTRAAVATPVATDAGIVADALIRLIGRVQAEGGRIDAVGIGSAGPVDVTAGTVSPVNIPAWRGFDVVGEVARAVPGRPVTLGGDGTCMALGEYWRGGHSGGGRTMLGVVVSTGVGGGLVIDGRIYAGPTGNAGHIGHTVIDLHGEPCPCGGCGCVELYASGPAMVRWAQSQGWPAEGCSLPAESDALDARVLAEHARAGHSVALAAFSRAADALAAGIVSAAALVDLDDVVIGGGVAAAGEVLFGPLRAAMAARAGLGFVRRTRIHPSTLGSDAGLLGAAALVLDPTTLRSL